jgi:DNA (cytosine-5)-methyltransferase 1
MTGLILEGFAGPGGWSTGLALLGHTRTIGVELDPDACATAVAAGHRRIRADVATFPLHHLAGRVDGLIMSPPCQAWSRAGKRLGLRDQDRIHDHLTTVTDAGRWVDYSPDGWADPRSPLVLQVIRWVDQLRPVWVACEQVPDVLPFWHLVARWIRGLGYSTAAGMLSAEQFGVPQTRSRAFLVARRNGQPARLPLPSHAQYVPARRPDEPAADGLFDPPTRERIVLPGDRGLLPWVSMADALGMDADHPARTVCGDRSPRWAYGAGTTSYATGWTLQTNQVPAGMDGTYQRRSPQLPAPTVSGQGNSWMWTLTNVQDNATARGLGEPAGTVFCSRVGNLRWALRNNTQDNAAQRPVDAPAPTMFFGARLNNVSWVADTERTERVAVWQAGVLQGFPPDYPWQGTKTAQYRQAGDAVPPPLAAAVLGELVDVDWRARLWADESAA